MMSNSTQRPFEREESPPEWTRGFPDLLFQKISELLVE